MNMAPTKKTNATYCREYRRRHAGKYKKTDKERKKLARDYRKCIGKKEEYENFKRADRERKGMAKASMEAATSEVVELEPHASSFKYQ